MLVLTRKTGQSIVIGDNITVRVISIDGNTVRLGIEAPRELPIYRQEIYIAISEENLRALGSRENLIRLKLHPSAEGKIEKNVDE
ncbi:MAG: carbon storage regulator CsrA [Firmicutes bacterium]|nr:carbon storage regulator CsrA [Bacillota bacterium]